MNAHDLHSGLSHFRFWAGTTPGGDDVYPVTKLHLVTKIIVHTSSPLPLGIPIFVTVESIDLAGNYHFSRENILTWAF